MSALTVSSITPPISPAPEADLDDASLRLLPAPITEPYPAARIALPRHTRAGAAQRSLALDVHGTAQARSLPAPAMALADPASVCSAASLTDEPEAAGATAGSGEPAGPVRLRATPPRHDLPPATLHWAGQYVQAAIEVSAGLRPPAQLTRWSSDDVMATLHRRFTLHQRLGARRPAGRGRPALRSVRGCSPDQGVVEASAVIFDRGRVRAVALRMERLHARWQVTALEFG
jgi:hypothetical protein